jgi:hypothetical protein
VSERLEARSEVLKLARILSVPESDVEFLQRLPSGELRDFREQVTNRMFDSSSKLLDRIAVAAKLLPSGVIVTIAQRAFGPLLCARAAGAVDTSKAIDVARRLPPEFLADTAVELDPRRVAAIIAKVPEELVVPVARELGHRQEYVAMGRFLAFVPDQAIVVAIGVLEDEALIRTAFVLEHKDRLDHAIGLLPPDRLPGVLRRATELELWPEALDLLDHLSDARRGPIADIVAEQDESVIGGIVSAVAETGLWDSLLPIVGLMSDAARRRLAAVPAFHETDVMEQIVRAAASQRLWVDLVPLIDALPEQARALLPPIAARLEPGMLASILRDAANAAGTLPTLLSIVREMDPSGRERVVAAIDEADTQVAEDLLSGLADPIDAAPLIELLTPELRAAIERAATRLGMEDILARAVGPGD